MWFLSGMSKPFRCWDVDQQWLFPPSVRELVPEGHLAHLVRDTVRESLGLTAILDSYEDDRGCPPYHPTRNVEVQNLAQPLSTEERGSISFVR